jgi:hypothetical protein
MLTTKRPPVRGYRGEDDVTARDVWTVIVLLIVFCFLLGCL